MVIRIEIILEISPIPIKRYDAFLATENNRFKYEVCDEPDTPATKTLVLHDLHLGG